MDASEAVRFAEQDHGRDREIEALKRQLEAERRRRLEAEKIRESVFGVTGEPVKPPSWMSPRRGKDHTSEHVPVLVASDFHWGERILSSTMGGVNAFDVETAKRRYRRLIEKTIDISFAHLPSNRYKGLVYLRLGDMISGEIHADLRESNELQGVPSVRSLVEAETWGLGELRRAFGSVCVISVAGNHSRMTPKPQYKRGGDSLDALSAWWLEREFRGDSRMTFHTPDSPDAVFMLHGRRYVATHGDKMGSSGGQGFIGPGATIARGMKRIHDEYARLGTPISSVFCGHFHTALALEYGWCNGSLPGYGEFSKAFRMTPQPPSQWLLFFHPKWGVTSQWSLRLEADPTLADTEAVQPFAVAP